MPPACPSRCTTLTRRPGKEVRLIQDTGPLCLRWYRATDLQAVEAILVQAFPDEQWTAECLKAFMNKSGRNNVVKVLGDDTTMYGVVLYSPASEECRIRRIAVVPEYRRQGYATMMLDRLLAPALRRKIVAWVRESNLPAQLLLKKLGFAFDPSVPRNQDANTGEDYYVFTHKKRERVSLLTA